MDIGVGAAVVSLPSVDPAVLSSAARIEALAGLAELRSWADAQEQRLLAAMAEPGDPPRTLKDPAAVEKQFVREEIACALRLAPSTVNQRLHIAAELVHRLPQTLTSLEHGAIGMPYGRCLAEAVGPLPDAAASWVEARVLAAAPH